MTGLIVSAFGVCAVAVVALGRTVFSLRSEVDSLARQVDALSGATGTAPAALDVARPDETTLAVPTDAVDALEDPPVLVEEPAVLITDMAHERSETEPTVFRVVSVTLAGPLIKVAALSHGLQRALSEDSRMRIAYAFRRELKQQRKLRRRQSVRRPASQGWRP